MDSKSYFDATSVRKEGLLFDNKEKSDPCYKVEKKIAEMCSCSSVFWKVKFASNGVFGLPEGLEENIRRKTWPEDWIIKQKTLYLQFGKFSVYPYCKKKMKKHVQKRILRVWLSNSLIRLVCLWTLDLINYPNKKTTDLTEEEGVRTELRKVVRTELRSSCKYTS